MKLSTLKSKIKELVIRNSGDVLSTETIRSMNKKELKTFINANGGFSKGKLSLESLDDIPEGAFGFKATLSDGNMNMNGYVIELTAWEEGLARYMSDFSANVYLQHDMDQPVGKTVNVGVEGENLVAVGYAYDDLTNSRISRGLVTDTSTGHIALEVFYVNGNERLTPEEYWNMIESEIDRLRGEGENWKTIREHIAQLRADRVETHTKVQMVEWSFVSVGSNTSAEIKEIKANTLEKLETITLETIENDVEEEEEEEMEEIAQEVVEEEEVEENAIEEEVQEETQPESVETEEEETPESDEVVETENDTETVSLDEQDTSENDVSDIQALQATITELEATNNELQEQLQLLTQPTKKVAPVALNENNTQRVVSTSRVNQLLNPTRTPRIKL